MTPDTPALRALLACPFCGEPRDLTPVADASQGTKWGAIVCGTCSAQGPEVRTGYEPPEKWRDSAVEVWNERAPAHALASAIVALDDAGSPLMHCADWNRLVTQARAVLSKAAGG